MAKKNVQGAVVSAIAKKGKIDVKGIDLKQLVTGFLVEQEHNGKMGADTKIVYKPEDSLKIAVAHLREIGDYYTRLEKIENEAKS